MPAVRLLIAASAIILTIAAGKADELTPSQQAFRQIYQELVEINTTDSVGDTVKAAEAMAAHLRAAGITDVQVISTAPRKGNLVARLPGTGARRPILLTAHIDVVEAKREDWDTDPFKLHEKDGVFQARGAIDDKAMAAAFVANLIQYKQEGLRPDRDIILALTADEELSDSPNDGVHWLLQNKPDLINAELAINEGGGGAVQDGHPARLFIQLAEKVYQSYRFEVTDPGGHSAAPRRDNPIYRLAAALTRLGQFDFPVSLNPVTRAYLEQVAATENSRDSGRHQGAARRRYGRDLARAAARKPGLQRATAHNLRGHHAGRRPRRERTAANRARDHQLPHPAGRAGRRGGADIGARHR